MSTIDRDPFAHSPVFGVSDEADRARLTERSRRVEVEKGQVVICEGDVVRLGAGAPLGADESGHLLAGR